MSSSEYRPDIDGLRAVAILAVVAFHVGVPHVAGGYTGVDVFFVISGFLITGLLLREQRAEGRIDLVGFYARRVRRLVPAMVLVLLSTAALGLLVLKPTNELQSLGASTAAASSFLANIWAWRSSLGYFAAAAERMPLLHTWTLSVEEQFYVGFPLLLLLAGLVQRRTGRRLHGPLMLATLVASFALWMALSRWRDVAAFYSSPTRAWEFAAGALLAARPIRLEPSRGGPLAAVGLMLIAATVFLLPEKRSLGGLFPVPPVLGALAVIAGCAAAPRSLTARLLASGPMRILGRLSYSWYLWHWPLLSLVRIDRLGPSLPRDLALAAASLGLAALTFHFVEQPIRLRRPGPFAGRWRAVITGAVLLALCVGVGFGLRLIGRIELARDPHARMIRQAAFTVWPTPTDCLTYRLPLAKLPPPGACLVGPRNAPTTVLLFGDSHAQHLLTGLDHAARAANVRVIVRTDAGCKPYALEKVSPLSQLGARECAAFNNAVMDEIPRLMRDEHVSAVILSVRWLPTTEWGPRLRTLVDRLHAHGLTVAVGQDLGALPYDPPTCLARRPAHVCEQSRAEAEARREPIQRPLMEVASRDPSILLWDPQPSLCDADKCPIVAGGKLLYRDINHLSNAGSERLAPMLQGLLETLRDRPAPPVQPLRQ